MSRYKVTLVHDIHEIDVYYVLTLELQWVRTNDLYLSISVITPKGIV